MPLPRPLIVVASLLISSVSVGDIIEVEGEDYQLDDATGLQWLDLNSTFGLSVNEAIARYGSDGWVLATEEQFHQMYMNYDGTYTDAAVNGFDVAYVNDLDAGKERVQLTGQEFFDMVKQGFFADFGRTEEVVDENGNGLFDLWTMSSLGYYESAEEPGTVSLGGMIGTYYSDLWSDFQRHPMHNYYDSTAREGLTRSRTLAGTFLVRTTSVPEPSTFALLVFGLAGIGLAKRRHKV